VADDKQRGMTLDDVLASFAAPGGLPHAEMEWALEHWEEAGPRLLALLDAYVRGEGRTSDTENIVFVGIHLAADRGDTAAFAPLCRLLQDGEAASLVLGDAITTTLPQVLIALYDGDLPALAAVAEAVTDEEFIRYAAVMAMAYLTHAGQVPEAEMRGHLLRWLGELQPQAEDNIWNAWVQAVACLGWSDLAAQAEELFARGFVDIAWMEEEDFRAGLQRTLDDPEGMAGFDEYGVGPFGNVFEELKGFANTAPALPEQSMYGGPLYDEPGQPIINPLRGIGRNDPCPCGSGKKYKKCCLV